MTFTQHDIDVAAAQLLRRAARSLAQREALRHSLRSLLPPAARTLRERFGARRVILFGSLLDAPWFTEQSDIDLAVEGLAPRRAQEAESWLIQHLRHKVDLLLLEELAPSFRQLIEEEGEVLP